MNFTTTPFFLLFLLCTTTILAMEREQQTGGQGQGPSNSGEGIPSPSAADRRRTPTTQHPSPSSQLFASTSTHHTHQPSASYQQNLQIPLPSTSMGSVRPSAGHDQRKLWKSTEIDKTLSLLDPKLTVGQIFEKTKIPRSTLYRRQLKSRKGAPSSSVPGHADGGSNSQPILISSPSNQIEAHGSMSTAAGNSFPEYFSRRAQPLIVNATPHNFREIVQQLTSHQSPIPPFQAQAHQMNMTSNSHGAPSDATRHRSPDPNFVHVPAHMVPSGAAARRRSPEHSAQTPMMPQTPDFMTPSQMRGVMQEYENMESQRAGNAPYLISQLPSHQTANYAAAGPSSQDGALAYHLGGPSEMLSGGNAPYLSSQLPSHQTANYAAAGPSSQDEALAYHLRGPSEMLSGALQFPLPSLSAHISSGSSATAPSSAARLRQTILNNRAIQAYMATLIAPYESGHPNPTNTVGPSSPSKSGGDNMQT